MHSDFVTAYCLRNINLTQENIFRVKNVFQKPFNIIINNKIKSKPYFTMFSEVFLPSFKILTNSKIEPGKCFPVILNCNQS